MTLKNTQLQTDRRVYLREIAKRAGVSVSTVSRVLSNAGGISEGVQEHVITVAAELGYKKNEEKEANQLRSVTLLTSLHLGTSIDPFHADVLNGVELVCGEIGVHLSYATLNNSAATDLKILNRLQNNQVDGLLLLSLDDSDLIEQLRSLNIPSVMINIDSPDLTEDTFLPDNYWGAHLAMRHLIDNGHKHILHITQSKRRTIQRRTEAYKAVLVEAGIRYDPKLIVECEINPEETYKAMMKRFAHAELDFTAVFCANDLSAMGLMRAAQDSGLSIPQDISVIGFDDVASAAFLSPPLTTIRIETKELAALAVRRLIDRAMTADLTPIRVLLSCKLVERRSVARL
ncbi:MAG: LacI family DNA-binding transcriptional regulator [Chloroflexota bacterium]